MKSWIAVLSALPLLFLASCSQAEKEEEPDYDSMVFLDDSEDEEWMQEEFRDRKIIAQDGNEPQELILIEPQNLDLESIGSE